MTVVVPQHAVAERLGFQPHLWPQRPQADPVAEDLHPAQAGFDGCASGHDSRRYLGLRVRVPLPLFVRAAEQDLVTVREHVNDPRRFGIPADEELLDARVGGDDHLPAHRHHRRIGHQVVGGGAGAVDDDRGGAGQAGQRGNRGDLERAARPLEPAP